jgi:hypothetical protein
VARPGRNTETLEDLSLAPAHFYAWLAWASRSKLDPFIKRARRLKRHRPAPAARA